MADRYPYVNIFFNDRSVIVAGRGGKPMGRKASVEEAELMARLSRVFRDVGYEGATLTMLSEATGLKKASLYHRFPDGKEQMAREVLENAGAWLEEHILAPLKGGGTPASRIAGMVEQLDAFYSGGKQACLLNMLSSARIHEGPFTKTIKQIFEAWIDGLTAVLTDAGVDGKEARSRAERGVIMLQGSLVFSRGMGTTRPFREFLQSLPGELLAGV
jgi:TetR/AcrR family transcriptional regulator, lmrAB and yxaGH operons repressor